MTTVEKTSQKFLIEAVVNYSIARGNLFGENASVVYTLIYEELFEDGLRNGLSLECIEKTLWNHANQEIHEISRI